MSAEGEEEQDLDWEGFAAIVSPLVELSCISEEARKEQFRHLEGGIDVMYEELQRLRDKKDEKQVKERKTATRLGLFHSLMQEEAASSPATTVSLSLSDDPAFKAAVEDAKRRITTQPPSRAYTRLVERATMYMQDGKEPQATAPSNLSPSPTLHSSMMTTPIPPTSPHSTPTQPVLQLAAAGKAEVKGKGAPGVKPAGKAPKAGSAPQVKQGRKHGQAAAKRKEREHSISSHFISTAQNTEGGSRSVESHPPLPLHRSQVEKKMVEKIQMQCPVCMDMVTPTGSTPDEVNANFNAHIDMCLNTFEE
uniref:Uncharacterized protein n=1 Tax=Palpitomonas bilix TaxID=652834 RepID=A0A7S3DGJ7_9EUKA|mmetsp:Transcript_34557/g.89582  ORF Transcript_34557/g.89582 Transcript_34557/m.89582 type:complete len:307 (+) Transcript_34557:247-1167(+)